MFYGSASSPVQDELIRHLLSFAASFRSEARFLRYSPDEVFAQEMTQNHYIYKWSGWHTLRPHFKK